MGDKGQWIQFILLPIYTIYNLSHIQREQIYFQPFTDSGVCWEETIKLAKNSSLVALFHTSSDINERQGKSLSWNISNHIPQPQLGTNHSLLTKGVPGRRTQTIIQVPLFD